MLVPTHADVALLLVAASAFQGDGATGLSLSASGDGSVDDHAAGPKAVAAIETAEAVMAPIAAHHANLRSGLDLGQLVRGAGYGKSEENVLPDAYRAMRLVAAGVRAKSDAGVRAAGVAAIVRLESTSSPETVAWWLKNILRVNGKDARMLRHLAKRLSGEDADALRRRADALEKEEL